jgi:peptide deformylase
MAILEILEYPDPRLRTRAQKVEQVDDEIRQLGRDMLETMYAAPEILEKDGIQVAEEGCLSVPGIYDSVERAEHIRVRSLDLDGQPFEFEAEGLLAVCIQHEMDHLEGKLFVDYLSDLKRQRIRKKLEKGRRQQVPDPMHARTPAI